MHIRADLGAASNRHTGIHHGALIDKSADVDEARHQHDIPGDMRSMPCNGPRHSAETGGAELRLAPALKFRSVEHTSELQSLMSTSYAGFCWKTKKAY